MEYKDFFSANGVVESQWVSTKAQEVAKEFERSGLSGTQLRNFYNEFLRIKRMASVVKDEELMVLVHLMVAKVNYKSTKSAKVKSDTVPREFVQFLSNLVKAIDIDNDNNKKRFLQSCYIMEAIVGFYPRIK